MSERGAVVVGASHGVGRAIAEELAGTGWDLVLAARAPGDLDEAARELRARHGVTVTAIAVDIADADDVIRTFLDSVATAMPDPDAVLVPAGIVADNDEATTDWATSARLLATNMTGAMRIAGHYVAHFERRGSGTIVLFSSIAARAPRKRNVAYAAAKAGLESFGRSMQHRLSGSGAALQIYRLGYVDTRLARRDELRFPPADPAKVARRVVAGLGDSSRIVHEPRYWGLVTRALRVLPAPVYNRLDF